MKILFSGVGGSDPINANLDGPMLHCCRVYKPDIVYLYFTGKMLEYENTDHRYTWAIKKLGEKLGHNFEIKPIERPDCVNPQIFDTFFEDFENRFLEIEKEYPAAEIYCNASSGTPAMKNTMVIIAAMSDKNINVIQVSSDQKGSVVRDNHDTYDAALQWEYNSDNTDEFKDRTTLIHSPNFMLKVKKENIRRFINAYDYSAAAMLAESIQSRISDEALRLIKAAEERYKLNYNGVHRYGAEDIVPDKSDSRRPFVEYMLWLGVTLKRKDYLGFMRGITPAAMALMEKAFSRITGKDIEDYCIIERKEHFILSVARLNETEMGKNILYCLNKKYNGKYTDKEYTTAQLEAVIGGMPGDEKLKKYANTIRKAEDRIRNRAAHTIISIDDSVIKREIGISADDLYDCMKKMAVSLGLAGKNVWDSYEEMNERILKML